MPDNIETYGNLAAFASRGEPAWHNLGTVFGEDDDVNTQRMLELAHLDKWNVRLVGLPDLLDGFNFVSDQYLVVRDNPFVDGQQDVLATVGQRYREFQNEELYAFGDNLLSGGGQWETAGAIRDGRTVFGSLSLDKDVVLDPTGAADTVKTYLLVTTSHDGTTAIQAMVTPVRVVCQNTLNMALAGAKQTFKIRHTQNAGGRVDEARKALGLAFKYVDTFEAEAKALFETSVTKGQFDEIIAAAYPQPEADVKGALTRWENKRDTLMGIWEGKGSLMDVAGPNTTEGIRGTAWGALNTLTERLDWYRKPRKAQGSDELNLEGTFAAASGFDLQTNVEKNRLRKVVLDFASAQDKKVLVTA